MRQGTAPDARKRGVCLAAPDARKRGVRLAAPDMQKGRLPQRGAFAVQENVPGAWTGKALFDRRAQLGCPRLDLGRVSLPVRGDQRKKVVFDQRVGADASAGVQEIAVADPEGFAE